MTTATTTAVGGELLASGTTSVREPEKATFRDQHGKRDPDSSTTLSSTSTAPTMIASNYDADEDKEDAYNNRPDGGYGWLVVAGAFLAYFTSFGVESCWGIMQEYFNRVVFKDTPNAQLQLTVVGTLIEVFDNMMGPLYQFLTSRYGVRPVLVLATVLVVLGLELSGLATQIWHLHLSQGVLFGTGASLLYVAAMMVPSQWFNRRSAQAMGCVTSGSCLGGVALPFLMTAINNRLGGAWTYRIVGLVCLGANAVTCLLVKEKFPSNVKIKGHEASAGEGTQHQKLFSFEIFRNANFVVWMASGIISTAAYFIPLFFIPSYATHLGLSSHDGTSLMAIMSGSNFVGRICTGYLGDRIGRLNAHIISTLLTAISLLVLWVVADTYAMLVGFVVMFGFGCSSFYIFLSPLTARILSTDQFPTGVSVMILSNIVSVCGPPLATAIQSQVPDKPYMVLKMFSGACYVMSLVLLVVLKIRMTKSVLSGRV